MAILSVKVIAVFVLTSLFIVNVRTQGKLHIVHFFNDYVEIYFGENMFQKATQIVQD